MVDQIEGLVAELSEVRADNEALRSELRDAVAMLGRASAALGDSRSADGRRQARGAPTSVAPDGRGRRRVGRRRDAAESKATPTADSVRAAVGAIGPASAAQVADYIAKNAGVTVSGRSVRWVAERAGVQIEAGSDGKRLYRL